MDEGAFGSFSGGSGEEYAGEEEACEEKKKAQEEGDESEGEEDEIANEDAATPQREEVEVPIPWIVDCRFEATEEGVVYDGCCGVVDGAAQIQCVRSVFVLFVRVSVCVCV